MRLPRQDLFCILPTSLLRRTNVLPESPVQQLFPSGICCRPPRRYTDQPGPALGPGFFLHAVHPPERQVVARLGTASGCGRRPDDASITQMSEEET